MKQEKMNRENYWKSSGNVDDEKKIYMNDPAIMEERMISYGDAWLTLICC